MSYATTDRAPDETAVRRPRWPPHGAQRADPSRHTSRTHHIADGGGVSEFDPCLIEAVALARCHTVDGDRVQSRVDSAVHSDDRPHICWNDRSTWAQSWSDPTATLIQPSHLPARYAARPSLTKLTVTRREQPRGRLRSAAAALAGNAVNSNLRRAQLSFLGSLDR